MFRSCTQGFLAAGLFALATIASACGEPELNTSLRPAGDPENLAVLIYSTDLSLGGVVLEQPTYCKGDDEKTPTLIGLPDATAVFLCPEDRSAVNDAVDNADPLRGQVRIVFDELLDPDIEELIDITDADEDGMPDNPGAPCTESSSLCEGHITNTHPVELTCGERDIPYDGYYAPNGNSLSYPPGPSLVIVAQDFWAGGETCEVTINENVVDKDGNPVPANQRGPFSFGVAAFELVGTDPPPGPPTPEVENGAEAAVALIFNNFIDDTSVDDGELVLNDGTTDVAVSFVGQGPFLFVFPTDGFVDDTTYTLTVPAGSDFSDAAGGTLTTGEDVELEFTIVPAPEE